MKKPKKPAHISRKDWDAVSSPALTAKQIKAMRPVSADFPELAEFARRKRGQRGPQKRPRKIPILLRVDPDTLAAFKAGGKGYQTRMAAILAKHAK
jgi:uncharacterized protein (DUF4415 family)